MKKLLLFFTLLTTVFIDTYSQGIHEDFSSFSLPTGWTQSSVSPGDTWAFGGGLDFGTTSPINDPTGNLSEYARLDYSIDPDTTSLISPVVNISGLTNPELSFYYISQTNSSSFTPYNRFIVDYWNGSSWVNITVIDTLTTAGWTLYTFPISGYTFNSGDVQFRFSGQEGGAAIGGTGTSTFDQDMAFDEVTIGVPCSPTTGSQTLTICDGASITVGTSTYNSTGVYTDVLTNTAGCDSTVTTNLTVSAPITGSQTLTICDGASITVGMSTYNTTGVYTDVLTAANGCDSTVTTNLTVSAPITGSQTLTICDGASITVGMSTYNTTGVYTDVFTAANGCDSTVTTNLTVDAPITGSQTLTICDGANITVGTSTYNTTGIYTDVLTAANGCDSTVTTNLTVGAPITGTQTLTICDGASITVGTSTYNTTGLYTDVLTAANGCDSTVTTNLTVSAPITGSQTLTICDGASITVGMSTYNTTGVYTDVLTAANGCDSTVTTNLTVSAPITGSQTLTLCDGESITVGTNTYTTTGVYTDVLTATNGCDSTVTTNLTVEAPINAIITNPLGYMLDATPIGDAYQWIDCTTGNAITGETGQTFIPNSNGNYAVVITIGSCSDTSACETVTNVGLQEINADFGINIYPNPSAGLTNVSINSIELLDMVVRDVTGRVVFSRNQIATPTLQIDLSEFGKGMYFFEFINDKNQKEIKKLLMF